jgi:hypothetical protein
MDTHSSRRAFLLDARQTVGGSWLLLQLPWVASLAACARDDASRRAPFHSLTSAEAQTMRELSARILPSDDGAPGAVEAGAVYFVDRALALPALAESLPVIRAGLADLDRRSGAAGGFASLPPAQQIDIVAAVERTPFFRTARMLVVTGTLADPSHGGNRDHTGWMMMDIDHHPTYTAPFGWYDASPADVS